MYLILQAKLHISLISTPVNYEHSGREGGFVERTVAVENCTGARTTGGPGYSSQRPSLSRSLSSL